MYLTSSLRVALLFTFLLSACEVFFEPPALAQNQQQSGPRKPLPKPPTGSRGFEQAGKGASSRLIAVGATRGPLKPIAPYEGLAYYSQPFFAWKPSPGASTYHFTLRDGAESSSPVVFETDTSVSQLVYPSDAPKLAPGKLYSWRVSTAGVMERRLGAVATFFILAGDDLAQVKTAVEKAKLENPKTSSDRLALARVFADYGVWYDALRIASQLFKENPNDAEAKTYYDSLLKTLNDEEEKATSQTSSSALHLWQELAPLVSAGSESAAVAIINKNVAAANTLYRELLFDAVDSRVYNNAPLSPVSDRVRSLLVRSDPDKTQIESRFEAWAKERKLGTGFSERADGFEEVLFLYTAASPENVKNQNNSADTKKTSSRELTEAALQIAEGTGAELAIASCTANLAYYAMQERRPSDMDPLIERARGIWKRWDHPVGLASVAFLTAESYALRENWKAASENYKEAAQLSLVLPTLGNLRMASLDGLAWSLRNLGDKEGVLATLTTEVAEQQKQVDSATDKNVRLKNADKLAQLHIELGGACAALGRHSEAGEWYASADRIREANYQINRVAYEKTIGEWQAKLTATKSDPGLDENKRKVELLRARMVVDTNLYLLNNLASDRHDYPVLASIAERRLALARDTGDRDQIADALDAAAKAYRSAGDLRRARALAEEALSLRSSDPRRKYINNSIELLAEIAFDADDMHEAETRYRQLIEVTKPDAYVPPYDLNVESDSSIRATRKRMNATQRVALGISEIDALMALAEIQQHKGNYRDAEHDYDLASQVISKLYFAGAEDEAELSNWLNELGKSDNKKVERVRTVDVIAHRKETGATSSDDEMSRLQQAEVIANGMRAVLALKRAELLDEQGDLNAAAKAYEDAITQTINSVGGSFPLTGSYLALARIERERGNFAAAEAPLQAALGEAQRKHDSAGIAGIFAQQSELRRQQGRLVEGRQIATEALKLASVVGSRVLTAGIQRTLGRIESDLGGSELKSAEENLRASLLVWRDMGLRAHVAYTLSSLGQTQERLGHDDDALASYEEAVKLVEMLTASLSRDVSADTFDSSRANKELYDRLIKLLIKHGRAGEAMQYLERAKSKSLVDALAGANVGTKDPGLKALIEQVRTLGDSVREAETALATEMRKPESLRDVGLIRDARARLDAATKQYLDAVSQIQKANPSYASLVAVNPTNLVEVQKHLPDKTVLLEYFPTETQLYVFVVTHESGPSIRTVSIPRADLAKLVMQYREALEGASEPGVIDRSSKGTLWKDDGTDDFKQNIAPIKDATLRLYKLLIGPVQAEVDKADTLVVVPAAELYYLPIHALGRESATGQMSFLIEQKRFAYLASADLLNAVDASGVTAHSKSHNTLVALGNPDGSLPAATKEVSDLGRIFTGSSVFTGNTATMASVTQSSTTASFLHFATHGFINSLDPKETYLLLAGKPDRLSVKDIVEDNYKLSLSGTRLVTLSACETNIGGYDPSAVYSSLSRAFSKAGAPTVVASLWSVNDESTRVTMTNFYNELASGQPKAEAMRRAQLAVMHDPRFAHPYFWAPFVILGDWR